MNKAPAWSYSSITLFDQCNKCKAQPEQEPVAWMSEDEHEVYTSKQVDGYFQHDHIPLYTTPPAAQKQWVGLTGDEWLSLGCKSFEEVRIGLAIQAKLKEKNT